MLWIPLAVAGVTVIGVNYVYGVFFLLLEESVMHYYNSSKCYLKAFDGF